MDTTHSYVGRTTGDYAWKFYLVLSEDPAGPPSGLPAALNDFARRIGHQGLVVAPWPRDVERTFNEVLEKDWAEDVRSRVLNTPGILAIQCDFADFRPKCDPWLHVDLSGQTATALLDRLAEVVNEIGDADQNQGQPYQLARRKLNVEHWREVAGAEIRFSVPWGVSMTLDGLRGFLRAPARTGPAT